MVPNSVQQMATQNLNTLSTSLFLHQKCQFSFVLKKIFEKSDHFRIKCLFYSKISAFLFVLYFLSLHFYIINLGKNINYCQKISFTMLYLTLVTQCNIGQFLCCHLLHSGRMIVLYLCAQFSVLCTYNCLPGGGKDNIYIDMQAGRNLLPKLLVADN